MHWSPWQAAAGAPGLPWPGLAPGGIPVLHPAFLLPYPPFPAARPDAPAGAPGPAPAPALLPGARPAAAFALQPLVTGGTYTLVFRSGELPAGADTAVREAGGTVTDAVPQVGVLAASSPDPEFLARLRRRADLAAASPALTVHLRAPKAGPVVLAEDGGTAAAAPAADLFWRFQWDIRQVTGEGRSFELGTGSHDVVVGVVDTGIDAGHPDLRGNVLGARHFHPGVTDGRDEHGHGTHLAGAIAGCGRILGVGPHLGLRAYRVFAATGGARIAWIVAALVAAADEGVDVILVSPGGFEGMSRYYMDADGQSDVADFLAWRRAVQYALQRGAAVVAAAGNDALDAGNPRAVTAFLNAEFGPYGYVFRGAARQVPGTVNGVLAVSSTGPDGRLAAYSNYGPGAIDIAAPGGDFGRYPQSGWWTDMCLGAYPGGRYAWMAGTAMAAAKVAAAVALAAASQLRRTGRKPHPARATAAVLQAARSPGHTGADPLYGRGLVDALALLGG